MRIIPPTSENGKSKIRNRIVPGFIWKENWWWLSSLISPFQNRHFRHHRYPFLPRHRLDAADDRDALNADFELQYLIFKESIKNEPFPSRWIFQPQTEPTKRFFCRKLYLQSSRFYCRDEFSTAEKIKYRSLRGFDLIPNPKLLPFFFLWQKAEQRATRVTLAACWSVWADCKEATVCRRDVW